MSQQGKYAVSDLEYNIITTMSNLLQGTETLAKYQADAEQAGDSDTAAVFQRIHDSYNSYASELRELLRRMVNQS